MNKREVSFLGNVQGHDIRVLHAGQFRKEPVETFGRIIPDGKLCDAMVQRIAMGERQFDNHAFPVTILDSELFYVGSPDAIGNRVWYAKLYLNGQHDDLGVINPKGLQEGERIIYASISYTPFHPDSTYATLARHHDNFLQAERVYARVKKTGEMSARVNDAWNLIHNYRKENRSILTHLEEKVVYEAVAAG